MRLADRLSGALAPQLAWRFLSGHRSRLLDGTARTALVATSLGVAAMVIAMALMTGYSRDLTAKLIRDNAAVGAFPLREAKPLGAEKRAQLAAIVGVTQVAWVSYGQGLLSGANPSQVVEVTLRGIDPGPNERARPEQLALNAEGVAGVVVGSELARQLGASEGQSLRLTALGFSQGRPKFRYQTLEVRGLFTTGFSEFDSSWLVLHRSVVEPLAGDRSGSSLFEFSLEDPQQAPRVAAEIERILGSEYVVTDWRELNRELFSALELQKRVLFLGVGLIVFVSVFHVASTLVVLVRERMRDIGALAAMGLAPRRIAWVFVLCGGFLGMVGTALGVGLGAGLSWLLTTFKLIRFNPEVAAIYFIDYVPFRVELDDLAAIVGFALLLTFGACLAPALRAGRLNPAEALRYQ